jgi:hypothetical protein
MPDFKLRDSVTINFDIGNDFNIDDGKISQILMIAVDKSGNRQCIGFYGKGRREQQSFFYNPYVPQAPILRVGEHGVTLDATGSQSSFRHPGKYRIHIEIIYSDGDAAISSSCALDVL